MPEKEVKTKPVQKKKKDPGYVHAVGRRKTANARVRLYAKKGPIIVNDKPIEAYFPLESHKALYLEPFRITETLDRYSASIKVLGSGQSGQLGAVVHGLARALAKADPKYRTPLKRRGLLTRDQRMKERRKPGLAQAARARKQSPKR